MKHFWYLVGIFPIVLGDASQFIPMFPELDITLPAAQHEPCRRATSLLLEGLRNQTLWAMRMKDATAQGTTGVLFGSMWQLGNFDECLLEQEPIRAQYCLLDNFLDISNVSDHENYWGFVKKTERPEYLSRNKLHVAICVPAACSATDVQTSLQAQMDNLNYTGGLRYKISLDPDKCTSDIGKSGASADEIAFWILCSILVIAITLGTILRNLESVSWPMRTLRCFSLSDNIGQLLEVNADDSSHHLAVLHGVKVLSIILIFCGHRLGIPSGIAVSNYQEVEEQRRSLFPRITILQADLAVDSFFYISGVLTTYTLCRFLRKGSLNPIHAIFVRLSRIAPTYYVFVWFQASAAFRLGSGPLWNFIQKKEAENCANYWWANIFYFNNYLHGDSICHVHSWFIPCDVHFFIASLPVIHFLMRRPFIGKLCLSCLIFLTLIPPGLVVYNNSIDPIIVFYDSFLENPRSSAVFSDLYIPSHLRVTVYLIGVAVGYVLYLYDGTKYKITKKVAVCSFVLGVCLIQGNMTIGGLYYGRHPPGPIASAIFASLRRPLWAVGLTILFLTHRFGPDNPVSRALSSKPAMILSKLTLSFYLTHYIVILFTMAQTRSPKVLKGNEFVLNLIGDLWASCLLSCIPYLLLELPMKRFFREVILGKSVENAPSKTPKEHSLPQEIVSVKL